MNNVPCKLCGLIPRALPPRYVTCPTIGCVMYNRLLTESEWMALMQDRQASAYEQAIVRLYRARVEWKQARSERARTFLGTQHSETGDWLSEDYCEANRQAHAAFLDASKAHRLALRALLRLGKRMDGEQQP